MTSPLILAMHEDYEIDHIDEPVSNDEYDRDLSSSQSLHHHSHHDHHYGNYSITTSVTIRVTPRHDYVWSWGILWGLFVLATLVAAIQSRREQRIMAERRRTEDVERTPTTEGEGVSTADATRGMFRRLLLLAMLSRVIFMPIQIWSDPISWQFIGDTLPEMIFASAWTMLVSFFVQLVGLATGTGTNTSPGIVIQCTAYIVYFILILLQEWNNVATLLLYSLMCCIYSALFGICVYFLPRLVTMLRSTLHGPLAIRLGICTIVCISLFFAHTIGYAWLVVDPPHNVYWWWQYGCLELLPSVLFLGMMSTISNKSRRSDTTASRDVEEDVAATAPRLLGMKRSESTNSAASGNRRAPETTGLLKTSVSYGATNDAAS